MTGHFSKRWRALTAAASAAVVIMASGCVGPSSLGGQGEETPARDCPSGTLLGAGSTAQQGVIDTAIAAYQVACRGANSVNYDGKGSADGVTNFVNALTHFAGSDTPLSEEEAEQATMRCADSPAWHLPMVVGPIALSYNIDGVSDLVLDAPTTARIFSGDITRWNDPAITSLNPSVTLPSEPISVVHRSDSSGTTENFTTWLHEAAGDQWAAEQVSNNWKGSGEGADKSDGVATAVAETPGSITYVETSYANDYSLDVASVTTGAGDAISPDQESVTAALAGAEQVGAEQGGGDGDLRLELDPTPADPGAYPLMQVTYEIVCSRGLDSERTILLKDFLTFLAEPQTQQMLADQGYFPLPEELAGQVTESIGMIL